MSGYGVLSAFYDRLMADNAYEQRADYLLLAVYGDMTTEPPGDEEERWVLVAQNRKGL